MGEVGLNYCVQVMINEEFLDFKMAKLLSFVSRSISKTVRRFIEDNFFFNMLQERRHTIYQPKYISGVSAISQINLTIQKVKFHFYFNECIDLSAFTNITQISFSFLFDQSIENRLPLNLTHLFFQHYFNQPIDGFLPSKLTHLKLGNCFQNTISNLPLSLTHLKLGHNFNQPIQTLPHSVKQVTFCGHGRLPKFNQPVSHLNPNIKFQIVLFNATSPYQYKPNSVDTVKQQTV
eukprot:TRINITY_DN336_c0_g1_i3.p1 TRINITY_DN336_c0_g1~~TRINITY_DN336_c0_g1_i3.p1  ORF type:complete len:234 (+),score=43.72 TRINITY_DN336_c0_g1_i3:479-1180(+)